MKIVAVVLVLANLLLFGWLMVHQQTGRPDISPVASVVHGAIESLTLLRERPERPDAETPVAETSPERIPLDTASPAVEPTSDEQPSPVYAQPPDLRAPSAGPDPNAAESQADESRVSVTLGDTPKSVCQTIGPFDTHNRAQRVAGALSDAQLEPKLRTARIEQPSGYWVYLPSMAGPDARRIVGELSGQGVKDYFLGRQNFISLGVYSDKLSAERRVREISELGYQPKLEPRFLVQEVFWIDIAELSEHRMSDEQWGELLLNETGARRQIIRCE